MSSFHLNTALATWRRSLSTNRTFSADDLDELEQHLRDQIAALVQGGQSEKAAFEQAMAAMGEYGAVEREYEKVYWGKRRRQRLLSTELQERVSMLGSYLKVALRTLRKEKGYAFINVFGLAVGLTCFVLIGLFVHYEQSYDTFHEKADRTYRIVNEYPQAHSLGNTRSTDTPEPLADVLRETVPEVEQVVQLVKSHALLSVGDTQFYEDGIFTTGHLFDVFSFPLLQGDPRTALADPNAIVLTASLARKYFGDADPLGQTIMVYTLSSEDANDQQEMQVTGIVADVPANSHLSFNYLMPTAASRELAGWFDRWDSNSYFTYVALRPDYSLPAFEDKLARIAQDYLTQTEYYQSHPAAIGTYGTQLLTDIHLHSHLKNEFAANGDIQYVYLFAAIALLILGIACINYINLATARAATRAREVGVRKVMGAHRWQLIGQFMSEAVMPSLAALFLAMLLVPLLLPVFNTLTARAIPFDLAHNGGFLGVLLLVGLGTGVLAGSYPAFVMSAFQPAGIMKGTPSERSGKTWLRNGLVVAQFTLTMVLIIGTLVIQRQLHFVQNTQTGIDRDQIIVLDVEDRTLFDTRYETLKQTLINHPQVLAVTAAQEDPTNVDAASYATAWESAEAGQRILVNRSIIQHGFVDLFGLELVEGRDFSPDIPTDAREGMLINETLKHQLGWETAVGKWFNFHGREARITGVVKDFNFHSFHAPIEPLALFLDSGWWFPYQRVFVKVRPDAMTATLAFLEETMQSFSPSHPFTYHFLDDTYAQMYQTETRLGRLLNYFTFLALFIACLGLLGLAAFTTQQRTKEIGVRKVLGASVSQILLLLSRDVLWLILLALLMATPLAYLAMRYWLGDFAYHIELSPWIFLLTGISVLLIALATVSYQSLKAALADPVKSLRYE